MTKTAIITGGTKGLGRKITLALSQAGYTVIALYANDEKAAAELVRALQENGCQGEVRRYDVRTQDDSLWQLPAIQQADCLTLVHNACAPFSPTPMHQLTWADFENNFQLAVGGAWNCALPLIRLMIKKGRGNIVTILTSAVEQAPPKGFSAYVTAKHALRGFTLALAAEYGARGLKTFSLSPGYMETALTAGWDSRFRDTIRANSGRLTSPAAAARTLLELLENEGTPGQGENYPV